MQSRNKILKNYSFASALTGFASIADELGAQLETQATSVFENLTTWRDQYLQDYDPLNETGISCFSYSAGH